MENGPFEDVFPIKHGDIPASYVSLPKGNPYKWPSPSGQKLQHIPLRRLQGDGGSPEPWDLQKAGR